MADAELGKLVGRESNGPDFARLQCHFLFETEILKGRFERSSHRLFAGIMKLRVDR